MRYKIARRILLFWCLFIGIGAVAGSIGMLVDISGGAIGMTALLPYFQVLPFANVLFQNFLFPGIALLIVNGITNLVAAAFLLAKKKAGIIMGGIFGVTLMCWIIIQFVIFPANFLSIIYFIFGAAQAITGYACYVFYEQEHFYFSKDNYKNINKSNDILVAYFSRMGYTQKLAYEKADETGAEIYEIRSTEITKNTNGFWWCGRYGMHKWKMPIEKVNIDVSKYSKIIIVTPIWVFNICAPVRSFCSEISGKVKSAEYIINHFNFTSYKKAADEMDSLLGIKAAKVTSVTTNLGKTKNIKEFIR